MACLDENQLVAFVANALAPKERKAVEEELDRCESCRLLLCDWARASIASEAGELAKGSNPADSLVSPLGSLRTGSRIDRFEIIDYLGAGGMGVVFRCKDLQLDREIALKLLRPQFRQNRAATRRLVKEAKTMAQLKHPNVLTIYDSGEEGDLVYLAMELATGGTLSEWIEKEEPKWQETVLVFADAAAGLAAAHKAGIVHRDVKPGNLLMDARNVVRVADFGLAQAGSIDVKQTADRSLVGTIQYMAPEVLAGHPATESSEQFSLCVSLYEALRGERPYPGNTIAEMEASFAVQPPLTSIPKALRPVMGRGLSLDPKKRHESMLALELALRDSARPRSKSIFIASGVAAATLIGAFALWGSSDSNERCKRATGMMDGIWNLARSSKIESAFLAGGRSHAPATWSTSAAAIHRYSNGWLDAQQSICRATWVSGEQSETLLDARMHCLHQQLYGLRSMLDHFEMADHNTVDKALAFIDSLAEPKSCSEEKVVRWRPQTTLLPADIRRQERLSTQLADADSLYVLGNHVEAEQQSRSILSDANAKQDLELIAQAGTLLGQALLKQQQPTGAREALMAASSAAAELLDHRLATQIWIGLAIADGYYLDKTDTGMAYLRAAKAAVKNLGGEPLLEIRILQIEGLLALKDSETALRLQNEGLRGLRGLHGDHSRLIIEALNLIALTYRNSGDLKRAENTLAEALELSVKTLGPDHPDLFQSLLILGKILMSQSKLDQAWGRFEEGRKLLERTVGRDTRDYADALTNLAIVHLEKGEFDPANELFDESIGIRKRTYKADKRGLAGALINAAAVNYSTGNYAKAGTLYEESLALYVKALGPGHVDATLAYEGLGLIAVALKDLDEALHYYSLSREILESTPEQEMRLSHLLTNIGYLKLEQHAFLEAEATFLRAKILLEGKVGEDHLYSSSILTGLGETNYRLKQYAKAKKYLVDSIALQTKLQSMPDPLATTRLLLAYTRWDSNDDRPEALRLALQAKEAFAKSENDLLDEATKWLAAHN